MNSTFHAGGSGNKRQGAPYHQTNGAFQRPASLDNTQIPATAIANRQQQYTADIHNGTMSLEDTIASLQNGNQGVRGKPDTSHTVSHQGPAPGA